MYPALSGGNLSRYVRKSREQRTKACSVLVWFIAPLGCLLSTRRIASAKLHRKQPLTKKVAKPKATWLKPELLVDVEFRALTGDGKLRHPSVQGGPFRPVSRCGWFARP